MPWPSASSLPGTSCTLEYERVCDSRGHACQHATTHACQRTVDKDHTAVCFSPVLAPGPPPSPTQHTGNVCTTRPLVGFLVRTQPPPTYSTLSQSPAKAVHPCHQTPGRCCPESGWRCCFHCCRSAWRWWSDWSQSSGSPTASASGVTRFLLQPTHSAMLSFTCK